jgi:hypothetical protein
LQELLGVLLLLEFEHVPDLHEFYLYVLYGHHSQIIALFGIAHELVYGLSHLTDELTRFQLLVGHRTCNYFVDALEVWQLFIKLPTRFPLKSQSDMPPLLHLVALDNMRYN